MGTYEENAILARIASIDVQIKKLGQERASLLEQAYAIKKIREEAANKSIQEVHSPTGIPSREYTLAEKVALVRRLFRGREDVYALRWESRNTGKSGYQPACQNEWVDALCNKRKVRCNECSNRNLLPLTDEAIARHLTGIRHASSTQGYNPDFFIGIYPLLTDETCCFLAIDFDKETWQDDMRAFSETCRLFRLPAINERSRSGKGGHVWIFFHEAIPASTARDLGSFLLTKTMERRPDIGFRSYDRLFPNQDTLPQGGFGNLIALPLQHNAVKKGNCLFIDENFIPYNDQYACLTSIIPMEQKAVEDIVKDAKRSGKLIGVRAVVTDNDDDEPWTTLPSRRPKEQMIPGSLPESLTIVRGNQLFIDKEKLTPAFIHKIIRLAAFQNPEYYKAQAMRYSTYGKPRVISCAEIYPRYIALPRGCEDELNDLLETYKVKTHFKDERNHGEAISVHFQGLLHPEQFKAVQALLAFDTGVLSAPTAFGKTIIAAYLIAKRNVNTLILVHRIQLLEQWVERLSTYFEIDKKMIGQIGGGRRKPNGFIDIALLQSLQRDNAVDDSVASYGQIIVDECHHVPAVSFEQILKACRAKFVLGLSATVVRKDGHHPIIFMQCGPLRYNANAGKSIGERPFRRVVYTNQTEFRYTVDSSPETRLPIQDIYRALQEDELRNNMIIKDVSESLRAGRFPIILTERKEHVDVIADTLREKGIEVIVLKGGMKRKERRNALEKLILSDEHQSRVIVATGRYIGEGFDYAPLDTLFLAMPISWHGTLAQYAGRLHRLYEDKKEVQIYDYIDHHVPILAKMHQKRLKGYKSMGYEVAANR